MKKKENQKKIFSKEQIRHFVDRKLDFISEPGCFQPIRAVLLYTSDSPVRLIPLQEPGREVLRANKEYVCYQRNYMLYEAAWFKIPCGGGRGANKRRTVGPAFPDWADPVLPHGQPLRRYKSMGRHHRTARKSTGTRPSRRTPAPPSPPLAYSPATSSMTPTAPVESPWLFLEYSPVPFSESPASTWESPKSPPWSLKSARRIVQTRSCQSVRTTHPARPPTPAILSAGINPPPRPLHTPMTQHPPTDNRVIVSGWAHRVVLMFQRLLARQGNDYHRVLEMPTAPRLP